MTLAQQAYKLMLISAVKAGKITARKATGLYHAYANKNMHTAALIAAMTVTATTADAFEVVSMRGDSYGFYTIDIDVAPNERVDYVVCRLLDSNQKITGSAMYPVRVGYNQIMMVEDLPGTESVSCQGKRYGG